MLFWQTFTFIICQVSSSWTIQHLQDRISANVEYMIRADIPRSGNYLDISWLCAIEPSTKSNFHNCKAHLFRANTIKFLDETLATQHITPQNNPQNYLQWWPPKFTPKKTQKMTVLKSTLSAQWFIRWVGGEDQAQRESYIDIHQPYPSNHANSHHNKTNKARKL